jgi:neurotransmitter:Na+ symporter, NSS family
VIRQTYWRTRFGFYLAAVGSACGLGNLWRFPYVVGDNGGGAFVLLYVAIVLLLGMPLLIGEVMIGKTTRQSVLAATRSLSERHKKHWKWIGRFSVVLSLVVLSYYAVVSGWVLHFLVQFTTGAVTGLYASDAQNLVSALMNNGLLQIALASSHLLVAIVVVLKGVQDGLERWVSYTVPLFVVLLLFLVLRSLSLEAGPEALRFLLYPDFSSLTKSSLLHAIGHACFTLSIGFGTMVTFGSYLRDSDHIPTAGFRVSVADTFISLLAGFLVFPIVLQASNIRASDPAMLFEALPLFLLAQPGGVFFGVLFFLCLYFAALGASIGLLEVIVSNLVDRLKVSRSLATWGSGGAALLIATGPALSSSVLRHIEFQGRGVLELFDTVLINFFLPIVAVGIGLCVVTVLTPKEREQAFIDNTRIESVRLFPHWRFVLKYLAPAMVLSAMLLQLWEWFI